jgi:hypothetical protein
MNSRLLKILTNKPELLTDFPEWMLSPSTINEIRSYENTAIAEIAGRDSVAAIIRGCEIRQFKAIIPTIAYTGTEYGDWDISFEKTEFVRNKLRQKDIKVFEPILLGSPKFWWQLCGRYTAHFFKKFGFYSHCVGCHLYFHTIRIPVAKKLNCKVVIAGERELHDGKIKVNQIKVALDAYTDLLKKFGIELLLPLRHVKSGEEIESIVGERWDEGKEQLECVLSKNYQESDGSVLFTEDSIKRFLYEFALDTAEKFVMLHKLDHA